MELLLTPLVSSLLRKFIKSSAESAGGELKVSFSTRGALTLHNLELNLEPLLEGVSFITAKRAFARVLRITVPWTALTTQPVEVRQAAPAACDRAARDRAAQVGAGAGASSSARVYHAPAQVELDTVELIFGPLEQAPGGAPDAQQQASEVAAAASSWLGGALQSMVLHAALNISIRVTNVVAKYVQAGAYVATFTCQSVQLATSADDWRRQLAVRTPAAAAHGPAGVAQMAGPASDTHAPDTRAEP